MENWVFLFIYKRCYWRTTERNRLFLSCQIAYFSFFAGLSERRFSIPAPDSHRSVVSLSLLTQEVLAKSYPIQPVIQL